MTTALIVMAVLLAILDRLATEDMIGDPPGAGLLWIFRAIFGP